MIQGKVRGGGDNDFYQDGIEMEKDLIGIKRKLKRMELWGG